MHCFLSLYYGWLPRESHRQNYFASSFDYVASDAHRTQPGFQRFIRERAEKEKFKSIDAKDAEGAK